MSSFKNKVYFMTACIAKEKQLGIKPLTESCFDKLQKK